MLGTCKGIPWGGTTLALTSTEAKGTPRKSAFGKGISQRGTIKHEQLFCLEPETFFCRGIWGPLSFKK